MRLRSILTFSLLIVILLVGCAPATAPETTYPGATSTGVNSGEALPTESPAESPQAVATSRGPNLEATDPTTVSLNSGDLQFVEFFRFT